MTNRSVGGVDKNRRFEGLLLSVILLFCCAGPARVSLAGDGRFRCEESLGRFAELGVQQIVFTSRLTYDDPHWYANLGYYCDDENHKAYAGNGQPDESGLYLWDATAGSVCTVFDAREGVSGIPICTMTAVRSF
ncbi:MAG TPA: hypothetical protein PK373_11390, partial [Sedimentisphaerales bacterium]|nr:hypothetical protein [Sedimentisphaerales bacterium]